MEHAYAEALMSMIREGIAPKKAVSLMHEALVARGRGALLPKIARAFTRLGERENRRERVVLALAREKDRAASLRETKALLKELDADTKDIVVHVDESLIGGWRLEGREMLADNSYKKQLLDIYSNVTK